MGYRNQKQTFNTSITLNKVAWIYLRGVLILGLLHIFLWQIFNTTEFNNK